MSKRIIYTNENGGISIIIPAGSVEDAVKDVPNGITFDVVDTSTIPSGRTFRNAWRKNGTSVETDMPAAREIANTMRRSMRDTEMAPLDLQATIPSEAQAAEADRQVIRNKYATMQTDIDGSSNEIDLLTSLDKVE